MKDYSKFIPSSYGFITKYEIVGDEIHVYTPETKAGEPHRYPLNADWLRHVEKRLENQYQLVVENRDILRENIVKDLIKKAWPFEAIGETIAVLTGFGLLIAGSYWFILAFATGLLIPLTSRKIIFNSSKHFDKEMDVVQMYLENRKDMEALSKTDPNITSHLSMKTSKMLTCNESIKQQDKLDTAFSIGLMDKTKLKELRQLLSRYMISKSILEPQKFVNPSAEDTKDTSKKKVLKPENNNSQAQ